MKKFFWRWIFLAIAVVGAAAVCTSLGLKFSAKTGSVADFFELMVGVGVLGLLNATVGKLLKFLTIPLNCLTLGLFSLVINAAMLFAASSLEFGFKIGNYQSAFVGSLFISAFSGMLGAFLADEKDKKD